MTPTANRIWNSSTGEAPRGLTMPMLDIYFVCGFIPGFMDEFLAELWMIVIVK